MLVVFYAYELYKISFEFKIHLLSARTIRVLVGITQVLEYSSTRVLEYLGTRVQLLS